MRDSASVLVFFEPERKDMVKVKCVKNRNRDDQNEISKKVVYALYVELHPCHINDGQGACTGPGKHVECEIRR